MHPTKISSRQEFNATLVGMGGKLIEWDYEQKFYKVVRKLDNSVLVKLLKQIEKIFKNPKIGKYMFANRKGQRELYVNNSFRLYYTYCEKDNKVVFLEFSHKKAQ